MCIGVRAPLDLGDGRGGGGGGGRGGDLIARKKIIKHCPKAFVVETHTNGSKNKNVQNSYV